MVNWGVYGNPFTDFNEELTEQWLNAGGLGFSLNVARDWLNIGLKAKDADFAYWLELNGWSPELVLNKGDDKDLRKKYKKFLKKQPKKKPKPEPEKPTDPRQCKICDKNTFHSFKEWQKLHGTRKRDLSEPWITYITRPFEGYRVYTELCGECKVPSVPHLNKCSWFKK